MATNQQSDDVVAEVPPLHDEPAEDIVPPQAPAATEAVEAADTQPPAVQSADPAVEAAIEADLQPEAPAVPDQPALSSPEPKPAANRVRTGEEDSNGRRKPNQHSPTGMDKGKILLGDYAVTVQHGDQRLNRTIYAVPGPAHALREFYQATGLSSMNCRARAVLIEGTQRDAGDAGYSAKHSQKQVRQEQSAAEG